MRCLTLEKSSKVVFPINRNTAIHMRHTQSPSAEGFIAPLVLFAASNASARRNAHKMELLSHIHAGGFSCETENGSQECESEL